MTSKLYQYFIILILLIITVHPQTPKLVTADDLSPRNVQPETTEGVNTKNKPDKDQPEVTGSAATYFTSQSDDAVTKSEGYKSNISGII